MWDAIILGTPQIQHGEIGTGNGTGNGTGHGTGSITGNKNVSKQNSCSLPEH